jgi:poly-gamma-glutamate capsule biosynthesis protein CapA/YwtB (metallophosphatase superfamily)
MIYPWAVFFFDEFAYCKGMNGKPFIFATSIGVLVMALTLFLAFGALKEGPGQNAASPQPQASESGSDALSSVSESHEQYEKPVTFLFAGDIMLSRTIGSTMAKKDDYDFPYKLLGNTVQSADIAFANLETPVSTRGTNVGSIYSFRSDPKALAGLSRAGFDVVSIANNHIWDYGRDAFLDTISNLDAAGISHAGGGVTFDEAHEPALVEAGGHSVAFLAYTALVPKFLSQPDSAPAVAYPDPALIAQDIANAKAKGADIVVVSFHFGTEYSTTHDASQEALAHAAIDAGALIVVGHHPHVAEEIEKYKNGLILYSLGNFVFDQNFSPDTNHGLIVRVVADERGILTFEPLEVKFNASYQPFVAGSWLDAAK